MPLEPALPAMLIGRLAVASKYQGQGLGRALIADTAVRTNGFGIGAFALIVDAKDARAAGFYEANGFVAIPDEKRRMFLPMATAVRGMAGESKVTGKDQYE